MSALPFNKLCSPTSYVLNLVSVVMSKLLIKILIVLAMLLIIYIGKASAVNAPAPTLSEMTIPELITLFSTQHKVSSETMSRVISCESSFNPNAINSTSREYSVGLVQINLKAHKNITVEQAKDPVFAVNFLAENLAKGRGKMWSCYK